MKKDKICGKLQKMANFAAAMAKNHDDRFYFDTKGIDVLINLY